MEGIKVPLMIQKSDGGFGYGTTDMAAIRQRICEERGDFIVYITDSGQASHFELVFGAAKKAGFIPAGGSVRVEHVGFGVVLNEDGSRIKTRAGQVGLALTHRTFVVLVFSPLLEAVFRWTD